MSHTNRQLVDLFWHKCSTFYSVLTSVAPSGTPEPHLYEHQCQVFCDQAGLLWKSAPAISPIKILQKEATKKKKKEDLQSIRENRVDQEVLKTKSWPGTSYWGTQVGAQIGIQFVHTFIIINSNIGDRADTSHLLCICCCFWFSYIANWLLICCCWCCCLTVIELSSSGLINILNLKDSSRSLPRRFNHHHHLDACDPNNSHDTRVG